MSKEISWRCAFAVLLPYYASSDKKMSCKTKLVLGAIDSTQGSFTNDMMSEALGLSVQEIQQELTVLLELGYINTDLPLNSSRKIFINISKIIEDK